MNHRGTEHTEVAQRRACMPTFRAKAGLAHYPRNLTRSCFTMTFRRIGRHLVFALSACLLFVCTAIAQQDVERKTVAITYPMDETVTVKFRGTTLLPRLKGEAKVRRAGRRGTRVELSIDDDLPRASELGGIYTTYILWAISP